MRILLDYRPALRERTGVGEFVHGLARALATDQAGRDRGDQLAILTTSWKDRPADTLPQELPGVEIVHRRVPVRALTWSWNRLGWPPVEWLAGRADVVHAQSPLVIPSRTGAQVITIHDLDFLRHPERGRAEMRRDFPALVHTHAARADQIVVSSTYAAGEVVRELGVERERITICPPGPSPWAEDVAQRRAQTDSGSSILFLGTLDARKNISGLLEAYAQLRQRRSDAPPLVMAGQITPAAAALVDKTKASPLGESVRFLGYVADQTRPALYRDALMLVLPSFEEGFGLPVLDAMACGVPVVVSDRGSLPEVVGAAAQPVQPEDIDGLTARMEQLLDRDAARAAIARGFAQAFRYSWERCAAAARDAYREAIARHAKRLS